MLSLELFALIGAGLVVVLVLAVLFASFHYIGPKEIGLVLKRFGRDLPDGNPVAFKGEAGYQADLLRSGWKFRLWPIYSVQKCPWVQISAGQIGVVVAQVGKPTPIGAKTGIYKPEFGNFTDLKKFVDGEGEKGGSGKFRR